MRKLTLLLCALTLCGTAHAQADAAACRVWLDGAEQAVIQTLVNHQRTWTSRPMTSHTPVVVAVQDGPVSVEIVFPGNVQSAVVRPLSLGIEPEIADGRVRFTLPEPVGATVEINGSTEGALHLFVSPPDADAPQPDDPGVIYLGPGEHKGILTPASGETVYLAEGAVLCGAIHANGVTDVRVAGRGIIDGSAFDRWEDTVVPINFENSQNITVEGITILDPSAWTLNLYKCADVAVRNVRIVGARSNSDGVTIQSCERVEVTDCFVRGWDDNLVVKGYDGDARDIAFRRCVLWTDLAQSCEIGYETRADVIERITFEDITVLHAFHKPVLSIHNSDNAHVRDILYRNIVVEDARVGQGDGTAFLIDLTTTKSQWSQSKERGTIRDVVIDGFTVLGGEEGSVRFFSFSKDANIDRVTLRNLSILGEAITSLDQLKLNVNRHNGADIVLEVD